jgi:hypothetical protein
VYSQANSPWYPVSVRMLGLQSWSRNFWKKKVLFLLRIKPQYINLRQSLCWLRYCVSLNDTVHHMGTYWEGLCYKSIWYVWDI